MERECQEDNTIYHITHLHPLKLIDFSNLNRDSTPVIRRCHGCRQPCGDSAYTCQPCGYVLDPTCARLPKTLLHSVHTAHPLELHLIPPYESGSFQCDACGQDDNFCYHCFHCSHCQFDLHLPCAALPETLRHHSHPHPLTLVCDVEFPEYICDLCQGTFPSNTQWLYLCKDCDFGGHVNCFTKPEAEALPAKQISQPEDGNGELAGNPAAKLLAIQQKLQQSMLIADMTVQAGRNAVNLTGGSSQIRYYNAAPLPSHYAAMANSMLMNNLALASMNTNEVQGDGGGSGGAPAGGNLARINDQARTPRS